MIHGCNVAVTNFEEDSGKAKLVGSLAKPDQFMSHPLIDVSIIHTR